MSTPEATLSVGAALARASSVIQIFPINARAGAIFERLLVDGTPYFMKRWSIESDWTMRVTNDRTFRTHQAWSAGLIRRAEACVDHCIVDIDISYGPPAAELRVLMRDVSPYLIPDGNAPLTPGDQETVLNSLADMAVEFWEWRDTYGLMTVAERLTMLAPDTIAKELGMETVPRPISAARYGWKRLAESQPEMARLLHAVHANPDLVQDPIKSTPSTFLHGDWKLGNVGIRPSGKVILLDWTYLGQGPVCWDLWWYVALNRERLAGTKETVVQEFGASLRRRGIRLDGWWAEQLDLCLIGVMATFGWEKALGGGHELAWWAHACAGAATRLGLPM